MSEELYTQDEERELWSEYERRKSMLQDQTLTPYEYDLAIERICEELGI